MPVDIDTVRREAMALAEEERAEIAADLLFSLSDDDGADHGPIGDDQIDQEWAIEVRRRRAELASGEVQGVPWSEVLQQVRQRRHQE